MGIAKLLEKLQTKKSSQRSSSASTAEDSTAETTAVFHSRRRLTCPIDRLADEADRISGIRKGDLGRGDWVLVTTKNSTYSICFLGADQYAVTGGWFDREGLSPQVTTISGCSWGGSAIKTDLVAAPGLFLGFGNSIVTTRIRNVQLIRQPTPHYA